MVQMKNVYSSHVDEIGYDLEKAELHVQYSSGKYAVYNGVSPDKAKEILSSASIGKALHELVRGQHEHEYR